MAKTARKMGWVKPLLVTYWSVVAVFGVFMLTGYSYTLSGASAANENATGDTTGSAIGGEQGGIGFDVYVCDILLPTAGTLIAALTVLMIIAGGVVYATSQGSGSGDLSVGTAKQMIMAALTGALLYMLGTFLLGDCGINSGDGSGFVKQFFDSNFSGGPK